MSKYAKKKTKQTKKPVVAVKLAAPVFLYESKCCNVPATKPACIRSKDDRDSGDWSKASLGTWICSRCKRKAKVSRSLNKEGITVGSLSNNIHQ